MRANPVLEYEGSENFRMTSRFSFMSFVALASVACSDRTSAIAKDGRSNTKQYEVVDSRPLVTDSSGLLLFSAGH